MQINPAKFHIRFVKHAVIADAQFEFSTALQPLMRETFQPCAHFIYFTLHSFTNGERQIVKRLGESGRPDLQRCGHGLLGLARRVRTFGNLTAGLVELGLHLISKFKLAFKKVINPCANLLDLGTRELGENRFDFLNRIHDIKDNAASKNGNSTTYAYFSNLQQLDLFVFPRRSFAKESGGRQIDTRQSRLKSLKQFFFLP